MTDEEINIAIAKACGWELTPNAWWYKAGEYLPFVPDYCNDLNAMHEAEKVLKGGMRSKYDAELTLICLRDYNFIWESTARQRAEAFLKTLNLWR